ncbi:hypothetical protein [Treponema endosymbiont of Eucomonympha sp.]|uniref:hypothetical protein n=1 Tax=Treponema endosymbiont of Eucomonympha sp. TaxID=1580831 RepID=UPI001396AC37|nr:hypothetical protein [Treponema endosymbiont of Eucomonympha sp.]
MKTAKLPAVFDGVIVSGFVRLERGKPVRRNRAPVEKDAARESASSSGANPHCRASSAVIGWSAARMDSADSGGAEHGKCVFHVEFLQGTRTFGSAERETLIAWCRF